ncbi:MAG: TfoX/Sxy family DNA transformation protein [Planctomycetota bacterium]
MSVSDDVVEEALHRLRLVGEVRPKRMFGGVGLYHDGVFFALLHDDRMFFKVDEESRPRYEAAGMEAFTPGGKAMKGYYEVPLPVQAEPQQLAEWAIPALALARRAAKKRPSRRANRSDPESSPIATLKNLGPVSTAQLKEVGLHTRADLEQAGSVEAYRRVCAAGHLTSLNLLWALEGALLGVKWTELPEALKDSLRQRLGKP